MSNTDWIRELLPEAEAWQHELIDSEFDKRDAEIGRLHRRLLDTQHGRNCAEAQVEKLNGDIRCMVEKAAAQHLPGYRELAAKCAVLETQVDRLKVLLKNAAPYVDACHDEAESQHDDPEDDYYMDLGQYEIMQETEELMENIK